LEIKVTLESEPTAKLNSRLLLPKVQFQLPLKLTPMSSNLTEVVSSTANNVEPTLTTVLSLSDMEIKEIMNTTLLETPGEPHGERMDTLELPPSTVQVSAVSKWNQ